MGAVEERRTVRAARLFQEASAAWMYREIRLHVVVLVIDLPELRGLEFIRGVVRLLIFQGISG
ncbi:MAG: hypothetical protein ACI9KE_006691 [Polyangiales bacterium]|jgi:hypothetical protein